MAKENILEYNRVRLKNLNVDTLLNIPLADRIQLKIGHESAEKSQSEFSGCLNETNDGEVSLNRTRKRRGKTNARNKKSTSFMCVDHSKTTDTSTNEDKSIMDVEQKESTFEMSASLSIDTDSPSLLNRNISPETFSSAVSDNSNVNANNTDCDSFVDMQQKVNLNTSTKSAKVNKRRGKGRKNKIREKVNLDTPSSHKTIDHCNCNIIETAQESLISEKSLSLADTAVVNETDGAISFEFNSNNSDIHSGSTLMTENTRDVPELSETLPGNSLEIKQAPDVVDNGHCETDAVKTDLSFEPNSCYAENQLKPLKDISAISFDPDNNIHMGGMILDSDMRDFILGISEDDARPKPPVSAKKNRKRRESAGLLGLKEANVFVDSPDTIRADLPMRYTRQAHRKRRMSLKMFRASHEPDNGSSNQQTTDDHVEKQEDIKAAETPSSLGTVQLGNKPKSSHMSTKIIWSPVNTEADSIQPKFDEGSADLVVSDSQQCVKGIPDNISNCIVGDTHSGPKVSAKKKRNRRRNIDILMISDFPDKSPIPTDVSPKRLCLDDTSLKSPCPTEVSLNSLGPTEVPLKSPGPNEVSLKSSGPNEVSLKSPGPTEVSLNSLGPNEVSLKSPGPNEVSLRSPGPKDVSPKIPGPKDINPNMYSSFIVDNSRNDVPFTELKSAAESSQHGLGLTEESKSPAVVAVLSETCSPNSPRRSGRRRVQTNQQYPNVGHSLLSVTKKQKLSESPENVEDLYRNKLWRSQMPKEKSIATIFEEPKRKKSGPPSLFSAQNRKRFIEFDEFYNLNKNSKIQQRRKRALQMGWKPHKKQLNEEGLDKMDILLQEKISQWEQDLSDS